MNFVLSDIGSTILRSIASLVVLFLITKIMGYRQISQLSFYDYIIGISIGSISADMATDLEMDLTRTIIPLIIYGGGSVIISYLTMKSMKIRRWMTGTSVILIDNGKLVKENLYKVKYDINDFLADCRQAGYFNVNDICYAVMEHNGKISFLPFPGKRPCTPEDLNLSPNAEGLTANLIIDGKVMTKHLELMGRDEMWLKKQLSQQKVQSPKDVLLATLDSQGNFSVYLQEGPLRTMNVLD